MMHLSLSLTACRAALNIAACSALAAGLTGVIANAQNGSSHTSQSTQPHIYIPDLLPQNVETGQCYARVKRDAEFASDSEIVVIQEAYKDIEVVQARFRTTQQSIQIKDPSFRYVVRQPRFENRNEEVMTRPAYDHLSVTPVQFDVVKETRKTSAPYRVWKRGNPGQLAAQGYNVLSTANGGYNSAGGSTSAQAGSATRHSNHSQSLADQSCGQTCEIWCLVEVPAQVTSFDRKVMSAPPQVKRTQIPAQYRTVQKQVLVDAGGVEKVEVPAQYRTMDVQELETPSAEFYLQVPQKTRTITTQTLTTPESYHWARVLCKTGQVISQPKLRSSYGQTGAHIKHHQSHGAHGVTSTTTESAYGHRSSASGHSGVVYRSRGISPSTSDQTPSAYTPRKVSPHYSRRSAHR